MNRVNLLAVILAVAVSVIALGDALAGALTGVSPLEAGADRPGVTAASFGTHALCYVAIVAVLLTVGRRPLAGSRWLRVLRWLIVGAYAAMAVGMMVAVFVDEPTGVLSVVVSAGFVVMLVGPAALGLTLLVRGERTLSAWLLAAAGPVLVLTVVASVVAPGWSHPAYTETLVNLGLATIGVGATTVRNSSPVRGPSDDSMATSRSTP